VTYETPNELTDLLSLKQQDLLAEKLREVIAAGFGEVTIEVVKGRVRFVRMSISEQMPGEDT